MLAQLRPIIAETDSHERPHEDFMVRAAAFAERNPEASSAAVAVAARPPRMGHRRVVMLGDTDPGPLPDLGTGPRGSEPPTAPDRMFDLVVTLPDGDRVAFRTFSPRGTPPFPRHFIFELGLLTVMLGIVLYAMTRTITRPLA